MTYGISLTSIAQPFVQIGADGEIVPNAGSLTGAANLATGQVAVTTSATQIAPARANRRKIIISSTAAVVFYVGGQGVTTANGLYVAGTAGAAVTIDTAAAVYAVGAGNVTLTYIELY